MADTDLIPNSPALCCLIVGGGPAGMMLGFLLARAGLEVAVLEKHADFLRDFRGDTIHPSTLQLMHELGLLEDFLRRPHQQVAQIGGEIEGHTVPVADFSHLPTAGKFLAFMPQWEFLDFLAEKAAAFPGFHLHRETRVTRLIERDGRVAGVHAETPAGPVEFYAGLVVGTDGRHSTVREAAGLTVVDSGAPIDVLWMRISRSASDPDQALGRFRTGRVLITLNRGDYWQCAYVIPKGSADELRGLGLAHFRDELASVAPFMRGGAGQPDRLQELDSWDKIKLLTVSIDHLRRWWRPGLLCIGDAAHAMSPVGGVGINLAIQDAVAAANILAAPLATRTVTDSNLRRVQYRRTYPARMTQRLQVFIHTHFLVPALARTQPVGRLPLPFRLLLRYPRLRRFPARVIGLGSRPEHIHTPAAAHR